jgi:hypothetical protein
MQTMSQMVGASYRCRGTSGATAPPFLNTSNGEEWCIAALELPPWRMYAHVDSPTRDAPGLLRSGAFPQALFTSRAREHQHDDKAGGDNTAFKFSVSAKSALADWVQS